MTTTMPTISTSSPNFTCVELIEVTVWFSYKTPIAFQVNGGARVVRENDWGPTTGKHLNAIDGGNKKARVSGAEFERLWAKQVTVIEHTS